MVTEYQCYRRPLINDDRLVGETKFIYTNCPGSGLHTIPEAYRLPGVELKGGLEANPWVGSQNWGSTGCNGYYKFFFDRFELEGRNWPRSWIGLGWTSEEVDGSNIHNAMKACGATTGWRFKFEADDHHRSVGHWFASGNLPIGMRNCLGNKLMELSHANNMWGSCL